MMKLSRMIAAPFFLAYYVVNGAVAGRVTVEGDGLVQDTIDNMIREGQYKDVLDSLDLKCTRDYLSLEMQKRVDAAVANLESGVKNILLEKNGQVKGSTCDYIAFLDCQEPMHFSVFPGYNRIKEQRPVVREYMDNQIATLCKEHVEAQKVCNAPWPPELRNKLKA